MGVPGARGAQATAGTTGLGGGKSHEPTTRAQENTTNGGSSTKAPVVSAIDRTSTSEVRGAQATAGSSEESLISRLMDRLEIMERGQNRIQIDALPHVRDFSIWKRSTYSTIAMASKDKISTLKWLKRIDDANTIEELEDNGPSFEYLSDKIADALFEIIHGDLKSRVCNLQDKLFAANKFINGRQLIWLVFQDYKRPELDIAMLDFDDLMAHEIKGENLSAYINKLDKILLQIVERPSDAILESLLLKNVRKCAHFAPVLALYEYEHLHKGGPKSYESLLQVVRNHIAYRHAEKVSNQMRSTTSTLAVNRHDDYSIIHGDRGAQASAYTSDMEMGNTSGARSTSVGICKFWQRGKCRFSDGRDCRFLHYDPEQASPIDRGAQASAGELDTDTLDRSISPGLTSPHSYSPTGQAKARPKRSPLNR